MKMLKEFMKMFLIVFLISGMSQVYATADRTDIPVTAGNKISAVTLTGTASTLGGVGNPLHTTISGGSLTVTANVANNITVTATIAGGSLTVTANVASGNVTATVVNANGNTAFVHAIDETGALLPTTQLSAVGKGYVVHTINMTTAGNAFTWSTINGKDFPGFYTVDELGNQNGIYSSPYQVSPYAKAIGVSTTTNSYNVGVVGLPSDVYASVTQTTKNVSIVSSMQLPVIGAWHTEEHEGDAFVIGNTISTMAVANPLYIGLTVPNGVTIHIRVQITSADGSMIAQLFSGNYGGAGVTKTAFAINKTVSVANNVTAYENVNTTTATASLPPFFIGASSASGGTGQTKSGSVNQTVDEDTAELGAGSWFLRITAVTANAIGSYTIGWYLQ